MMYNAGTPYLTVTESEETGMALSATILSFGGIVFGTGSGWTPVASDYNMGLPEDTSKTVIFILTFCGSYFGLVFCEVLGVLLGIAIQNNDDWNQAFGISFGNLMNEIFSKYGSGAQKFIMIILTLSVVANNIANTYSAGVSVAALGPIFQKVPRALWTLLVTVIYTIAGVAGQESFEAILSNLLSILSYWTGMFAVVILEEHFIFRRGVYKSEIYNDPSQLPIGIAGVSAFLLGIVGAVVGMDQTWYAGPIAVQIGYGDIGFELAALFAGAIYLPLRTYELKKYGR
ncbi:hypothetical protein HK100_007192 [Physocladia obscura]|uniref:Purine-cytosine permease n=1 Tax=Physocladia obscura TaxID=109957 RepID=A0AAD5T7K5_9FUNG|nr:hypothetical protein HK100_007192 [Physocladia obscura]